MSNLYVIGNCYSDDEKYAKELFQVLTNAGYTLAYNHNSSKACVIMKELDPDAEEETT